MGLIVKDSPESTVQQRIERALPRRPRLVGTDQQERFWAKVGGDADNVVLEARAGTGKSTSCGEGASRALDRDPYLQIRYVAFNSSIAKEFGEKYPASGATTMHSAGFSAIKAAIPGVGDEPTKFKTWDIVDTLLPRRDKDTKQAKNAIVRLANLCKGYLLDGTDASALVRLAALHGVNLSKMRTTVLGLVPTVLARCLAMPSVVDFSDMTWLPVMLELDFPTCDILFVDEAQDLDPCQHALVRRIAGDGRMVVVGDRYQAIYGFRGADTRSLDTLSSHLSESSRGLSLMPLTMTRRCPASHVEIAQMVVADFESLPGAPDGEVFTDCQMNEVLVPGVMALCRTNAPLVSAAFQLVGSNIPVSIQGKDIGAGLARMVESFEAETSADLMEKVERFRVTETERLAALENTEGEIETLNDQCSCIMAASRGLPTVAGVLARINSLFLDTSSARQSGCVLLSSIHRAKGREADEVAILCPNLIPHSMARTAEACAQERNLAYVAVTRSKSSLYFCGPMPALFKGV